MKVFEKSLNATFIALIPKKEGAEELRNLRPISLIGEVYKIISKLITETLKAIMGKLMNEHQMDFLKGRQITDVEDIGFAMEGLNHMIKMAKRNGWLKGFCASPNRGGSMKVTHLLYVDDSLVSRDANVSQIKHLRAILTIFEGISGMHVNWLKSFIPSVNKVDHLQLLDTLGCQIDPLPMKYLGLPLGAKNKETGVWNEILERSGRNYLVEEPISIIGRQVDTHQICNGCPLYLYDELVPKSLEYREEDQQVKEILLLWRFCTDAMALWRRFIAKKYGLLNQWSTKEFGNPSEGCGHNLYQHLLQSRTAMNDREVSKIARLLQLLNMSPGILNGADKHACILGASWVMPKSTMELLTSWKGIGSRGSKENWWMIIPACIWWTLWKERKTKCFEGKSSNIQKIKSQES
ncbi:hypothetical protein H5410_031565 [Solanum commersonii]|uniref:Reverse transcriptase domain-containing protein n=1 Tax=Solanum commersonii TaxID=4109 RepID=A0A9J5YHJ0_SOLCO|nr:hypothetical protein H5410_031565 [Solanum commersonii]